jgi:UDP-N-acetylglucosamine 2-epimerase (non-hydrolysing)
VRVATILGTRPEIIRLSIVIERLDGICDHTLVHTGQNFDPNLSDVFFSELGVRPPDEQWGIKADGFGRQMGEIIARSEQFLRECRPDRLLILGDTNSGLTAVAAARMGVPVYHMEAGNRCYDDRVPEEVNRRIIDHCSDVLMPYTHRSKENLVREGFVRERIFVTGNPIWEVITANRERVSKSKVLDELGLTAKGYIVVTAHRAENVDDPARLGGILEGLTLVADEFDAPVIVSLHPRTADRVHKSGLTPKSTRVRFISPVGFFDFVHLETNAMCVMTDSGTVQEEATLLHVPSVILRDVTERAECLEAGSGVLSGADPHQILRAAKTVIGVPTTWAPPAEYLQANVSDVVASLVTGYRASRRAA